MTWKRSKKRPAKILGVVSVIFAAIIISFLLFTFNIHLPPGRASAAPFLLPILAAFFLPSLVIDRWGIRKFKREWMTRGGFPAPSFVQS